MLKSGNSAPPTISTRSNRPPSQASHIREVRDYKLMPNGKLIAARTRLAVSLEDSRMRSHFDVLVVDCVCLLGVDQKLIFVLMTEPNVLDCNFEATNSHSFRHSLPLIYDHDQLLSLHCNVNARIDVAKCFMSELFPRNQGL